MSEFERAEELVVGLYQRGIDLVPENRIITIGVPKILNSGIWSPYLVNLRLALSRDTASKLGLMRQAHLTDLMLGAYVDRLDRASRLAGGFDHIYGDPEAGTPLAAAIAAKGSFSNIWRRVDTGSKMDRGSHAELEGAVYSGQVVVQVDDVATSGQTGVEGKNFLGKHGLSSEHLVVLGDREQGAAEELEKSEITLHAAFGATAMFGYLHEAGLLTRTEHEFLIDYTQGVPPTAEPLDHPWKKAAQALG
ncbi:MAG TPA: hypothetical protein VK674_03215 [Candidatus Limnocylindria bacterium]|nr:hypothetical protein [Candidatus Limnocylindria bacterium]